MATRVAEFDRTETAEDQMDAMLKRELARELHDSVAQNLTTMLIEFEVFRRQQHGRESVQAAIDAFQQSTRQVLVNLRELLYDLREEKPVEVEFVNDIRSILSDCSKQFGLGTSIRVGTGWPHRLTGPAALQLRRIVQEAVQNARIHGRASRIDVVLDGSEDGMLEVSIADDGTGATADALASGGFGVMGMKERAILVRGQLVIETRPRRGTTVRVRVPADAIIA